MIVSDIFSILSIDTYIVKLIPTQRNSTRNSTDKASWGWGLNIRKFNEKFHRQSKLGLGPQHKEIQREILQTKQVGVGAPT
ncbi:hypothetical protein CPZ21_08910 [Staphylococcus epidermidis]|nr:hypothetical protein CPZ21_08910 [Staphylococcus epidermidis]TES21216.1 hypothetical protein E1N03_07040 [Staphylococcus epidermidis]